MKQPNPLVPQGTFESQARGKSHVRIAVFTILAIHVVVLGALLIQGCKRDTPEETAAVPAQTNEFSEVPPFADTNPVTAAPGATSAAPTSAVFGQSPTGAAPVAPTSAVPPVGTAVVPPLTSAVPPVVDTAPPPTISEAPAAPAVTEHVIIKGDTFSTLAAKYGVSVKAIQAANPNVNPTRLKIGDKVKIPAKSATAAASGNGTAAPATTGSGSYTVKAGDNLSKIAQAHGTTVRELQKLNNLPTTQIRVGQKLKVPNRASAAPAPAPAPAAPSPATPAGSAPGAAPVQ